MNNIVLHKQTQRELEQFLDRPSHALGLIGSSGIGKTYIARQLASQLVGSDNIDSYPYIRFVSPTGTSISIETVRELQQFVKLKLPSRGNTINRIAIIEQAGLMTQEAQNALLKLLEEPPEDTLIILTLANEQLVLPTIRSRMQRITVRQPAHAHVVEHFKDKSDATAIEKAYLMSGGLLGLMSAILINNEEHELIEAASQARKILQASTFERLTMVDSLSKQKPECMNVLFMIKHMSEAALQRTATNPSGANNARKWQQILKAAYTAEESMLKNAQPRLALLNLMLAL